MIKIAIGGQLNKGEIQDLIDTYSKGVIVADIFSDMDAAVKVKNGEYDHYVGACQSGAGGALGMAYAILTREKCETIAMAGIPPKKDKVQVAMDRGVIAWGFTNDQADNALKILIEILLNT